MLLAKSNCARSRPELQMLKVGTCTPCASISLVMPEGASSSSVRAITPSAFVLGEARGVFSIRRGLTPRRSSSWARVSPVGPAPTMRIARGGGVYDMWCGSALLDPRQELLHERIDGISLRVHEEALPSSYDMVAHAVR